MRATFAALGPAVRPREHTGKCQIAISDRVDRVDGGRVAGHDWFGMSK